MNQGQSNNILFGLALFFILGLGLYLRLVEIETRPMHGDEANQAHRFEMLFHQNHFEYEPIDYHGPTLYYLTLPVAWLTGLEDFVLSTKTHFRIVPTLFALFTGLSSILLIATWGKLGSLIFSFFTMTSPIMVYYSTYYIQESLLVFFSLFFILSCLHYVRKPSHLWACLAGLSLGLMQATKETFIITGFGLFLAAAYLFFHYRHELKKLSTPKHWFTFFISGIAISFLFYSSFFTHLQGPLDSITSYQHQIQRGLATKSFDERYTQGKEHSKPTSYYLNMFIGSYPKKVSSTLKDIWRNSPARPIQEFLFILLPFCGLLCLKKMPPGLRHAFIASFIYAASVFLVYSFIPYKTPWLMMNFVLASSFACVYAFKNMIQNPSSKWTIVALVGISLLAIDQVRQSRLINTEEFCVTDKNPYAYVQPYYDVESLGDKLIAFSKTEGQKDDMPIHFLTPEYWPLPWYLKSFKHIGYWENKTPSFPLENLPVVITTPDRETLVQKLSSTHVSEYRGRLPGYHLLVFYRKDLWNKHHEVN